MKLFLVLFGCSLYGDAIVEDKAFCSRVSVAKAGVGNVVKLGA